MNRPTPFLLVFLLMAGATFAQKPIFVSAKVKDVTVYFNMAEISQAASVNLPKGTSEIVITNVSDYVSENTVQIGTPSTVTVLSVQFTSNYIKEYDVDENSPLVKSVRDSIQLVEKQLKKLTHAQDSESAAIELLDKNQQVYGANSGLNVAELAKMLEFYKIKRAESWNNFDAFEEKITKTKTLLEKLKNKLEIDTKDEEKTSKGKLILQVMNEVAGNTEFNINYLCSNAWWKPVYDLRAKNISEPIDMVYKAQVTQNTGIDWKKVKLTLSSGNPNDNNQAPQLNPWFLRYQNVYRKDDLSENEDKLSEVVVTSMGIKKEKRSVGYAITTVKTDAVENQLNISFDIDVPYDILSNGKAHSVALTEIKLPASYKYYAAPRVEQEAYLLAEINDYSKFNLLPGEANIIFEDMYVGKTSINPNQVSDTLSLSMGKDRKMSIKREKIVDKSGTKFLSSKKEQAFTYDITIRNNKKEAVNLMVKDQYPLSPDKDIEIELKESDNAKVSTETGILTWDLNLKPNETKKLRVSYRIRYPKDRVIENL
ncbi:MAG TPA: DUF4139 domain-containing protein [Flavobacterium sp.]|nr:DUF4139 domain-containing protein [Flavobacterium sp.]